MTKYNLEKVLPHKHPIIFINDIIDYNLDEHSAKTIININEKIGLTS